VKDKVDDRLKSALNAGTEHQKTDASEDNAPDLQTDENASDKKNSIVTTQEEKEGFYIVRGILSEVVEPDRIIDRDAQTYFAILLDDNNRKPICRLWFNSKSKKYLGLFDKDKKENKIEIQRPTDIHKYRNELLEIVKNYDS
jgi:hypothetical protein